jgi:phosphoenolpyruvate-protein kinase (PTS system EI component)
VLLGLGVNALSIAPSSIPRVKKTIREYSTEEAQVLRNKALGCHSSQQVRTILTDALEGKGLDNLLRT